MDEGVTVTFHNIGRLDPFAGFRLVGFVTDHALRKQPCDGLVHPSVSGLGHRTHVETRIEQMQDSVFNPSYVLVYRQPVISGIAVCRRISVGRGEAREVPDDPQMYRRCPFLGCRAFRISGSPPPSMPHDGPADYRAIEADVVWEYNR